MQSTAQLMKMPASSSCHTKFKLSFFMRLIVFFTKAPPLIAVISLKLNAGADAHFTSVVRELIFCKCVGASKPWGQWVKFLFFFSSMFQLIPHKLFGIQLFDQHSYSMLEGSIGLKLVATFFKLLQLIILNVKK